jgi:hypothetical protein
LALPVAPEEFDAVLDDVLHGFYYGCDEFDDRVADLLEQR